MILGIYDLDASVFVAACLFGVEIVCLSFCWFPIFRRIIIVRVVTSK